MQHVDTLVAGSEVGVSHLMMFKKTKGMVFLSRLPHYDSNLYKIWIPGHYRLYYDVRRRTGLFNITMQSKLHSKLNGQVPFVRSSMPKKYLNVETLPKFARILLWLFSDRAAKPFLFQLALSIRSISRRNGSLFMVLYLKECHRLVMKALGGTPEECKTFPRVATRRGLPLIIPGALRLRIEAGETGIVSVVLSLITVYRVVKCASTLKLSTITDPFKGSVERLPHAELLASLKMLGIRKLHLHENERLIPSVKAGPNYRIASLGLTLDAIAWSKSPELMLSLEKLAVYSAPKLFALLKQEIDNLSGFIKEQLDYTSPASKAAIAAKLEDPILGKLSEKEEAAGKIRVFAITDIWTQSILLPLHESIFRKLIKLPSDGTFDQLAPLKRLADAGHKSLFSYDLSAATDRLPITLQEQILGQLISPEFASSWRKVLTDRPWWVWDKSTKGRIPLMYSVGQPMGALSSWGMLALTHHTIVQCAARRVGWKKFFPHYAIIGDDLVLADSSVAKCYLTLMNDLGVDINMSKSLESEIGVMEFAKRLFKDGVDVSPVPPKLVTQFMGQVKALPTLLRDMMSRGLSVESIKLDSDRRVTSTILWEVIGPLGLLPSVGLSPFLGNRSLTEDQLKILVGCVTNVVNRSLVRAFYAQQEDSQILIEKIGSLVWDGRLEKGGFLTKDTPGFHHLMNNFIEMTIEANTTVPESISWPDGQEYTFEHVYAFIKDAVDNLDQVQPTVPDISEKEVLKTSSSSKMKFYRELAVELERSGVNFEYLTTKSLDENPGSQSEKD